MIINKRHILLFIVTLFTLNAFSQELIVPVKRIFKGPDDKLYVNKALPIYLRFSISPKKGAKSYLLKSESTEKYANPMYLDTEGYNSFHAPSAVDTSTKEIVYPMRDIIFEVYADSKPPKTIVDYGKVLTVFKEGKTFCGGVTEISLSAKDKLSGVEKIYFSLDSSDFTEYKESISLQEGEYILQCYSTDNVGNIEDLRVVNIVVDASNPATQLEVKGDLYNEIISGRSSINLIAADKHGIKSIYYTLDENPEKVYYNPIRATYLKQGNHILKYYSIDQLGNKETVKTYSFYVDKSAPRIVEEIIGNTFISNGKEYSSGRSKFKLITIDNKAGVKDVFYSINGGDYQRYEKPFYLTDNSGSLVIKSYAIDYVNNKSTSVQNSDGADIPLIDLSGPILSYAFSGPKFSFGDTTYISSKTNIELRARDYESGVSKIDYNINEKSSKEYTEPFNVNKEGRYQVRLIGYDNVDNTNNESFSFVVDNSGPKVFHKFSFPSENSTKEEVYPSHVVLFISATDSFSGYDKMYYSINGNPEKECFGAISNFIPSKDYNIVVKAIDKLGNETEYKISFKTK